MRRAEETATTYAFVLSPGEDEPLHVRFEPIGPDYQISPGDRVTVSVTDAPIDDPLDVTSGDNWVAIWAPPGAIVRATNAIGEQLPFLM